MFLSAYGSLCKRKGEALSQVVTNGMRQLNCESIAALPGARWYAVHTRSNFEQKVASELCAKGLKGYLPAFPEIHRWKDRKKEVSVPLFPGYVFVRMEDCDQSRVSVLRTIGVVRILGIGAEIERVPDAEIESIQQLLRSKVPFFAHPFLREGAVVRVKHGPLQGIEGLLVRVKNQGRLILSIQMLAQSVVTEVDMGAVEILRPAAA